MTVLAIGNYEQSPAVFRDYDPRVAEAASLLISAIQEREPRLIVDHIGSTAVPGCRGKGVIDLAVTYVEGDLETARAALDALGFQRQSNRDPFPETRPMRVASATTLGDVFQVHAHVILRNCPEHGELIAFRNSLRGDPEFRRAYEQEKERILANGIIDSVDYSNAKGAFIAAALLRIAKP
jgi:GrpB-like predicted nucleotidyltransferase (UPF0157 family)